MCWEREGGRERGKKNEKIRIYRQIGLSTKRLLKT
jgi:hypothetical protein